MIRSRTTVAAIVALAGSAALVASCRQIVGIEDRAVAPCGGVPYIEPACETCMNAGCCGETEACLADEECAAAYRCIALCEPADVACRIECTADHEGARNPALDTLLSCKTALCGEACSECAGMVDSFGASCDECVSGRCCETAVACAEEESCRTALECIPRCTQPDCPVECLNTGRTPNVAALQTCIVNYCGPECGTGRTWDCAGEFTWGRPDGRPSISYTVGLLNILTREPVAGATITACNAIPANCTEPLVSGITGEDGFAALEIPIAATQGFTGFVKIEGPTIRTLYGAVNQPLVSDETRTFATITHEQFTDIVEQLEVPVDDENRGIVFATALDCYGGFGPGVSFEHSKADEQTLAFYLDGLTPNTEGGVTTFFGTGGFVNVPLGFDEITMKLGETVIGKATVPVASGIVTEVFIYPLPKQ